MRCVMILCDINHNVSRLRDSLLNVGGGGYLRKLWEVKVTATSHTCTGLCEGMAAVTKRTAKKTDYGQYGQKDKH